MTLSEWLVALGSAAAVAAVYWWFFAAEAGEAPPPGRVAGERSDGNRRDPPAGETS